MSLYLEYLGYTVELPLGETVIGRNVKCALRFNDTAVSRRHLCLIRRHDEVFIEDLGSVNGTLINGRRLAAALRLENGDHIQFGNQEITIRVSDDELDEHSTLTIKGTFDETEHPQPLPSEIKRLFVDPTAPGRPTMPMSIPTSQPAAHQRCPKCAAFVSEIDDECPNCHYNWGSFRPTTVTAVRPTRVIRRRHERQPVELHLVYASSELEIEAMTRDLSEGGVFVCSQVLDPIGTSCQLTILVDGGPPLAVTGVVRRVVEHVEAGAEPSGLGVQFVEVKDDQLAWIRAVITRMSPEVEIRFEI